MQPTVFPSKTFGGVSVLWHTSGDEFGFQFSLYHKLESPPQFTFVKHCPRCPHTLNLAQSVRCSGPRACNSVCVTTPYWYYFQSLKGKIAEDLQSEAKIQELFHYYG